jgi:hypothetical protein
LVQLTHHARDRRPGWWAETRRFATQALLGDRGQHLVFEATVRVLALTETYDADA